MNGYLFHGYRQPRGQKRVPLSRLHEGRFGRMFRKLKPAPKYGSNEDENLAAVTLLAEQMRDVPAAPQQAGGWGSPGAPPDTGDNPAIPSGYTYFGQFVDHDITFDPVSQLQRDNDPDALHDIRSPRFDLDSLYGSGPADEPFQYDKESHNTKLLIGSIESGEQDLPRNVQDVALIGDPAQRREHHRQSAAADLPQGSQPLPRPGGSRRRGSRVSPFRAGSAPAALALPMDRGQRLSAPAGRS